KETSHKALTDFIDGCAFERHEVKVRKGKTHETHRYRFIEKVPLRDGKDAVRVNWIGFEISDAKGAVKYKTAVVTSLPVTKANVAEIVGCGRARWKIENESFNVLKNHGYELEHNFGHGEAYLAMTLAAPQHARLRLAHRARPHRAALAQGPGSGAKTNPLLRLSRNLDELRRLPRLARPPRSPRHLHHPAPPPLGPKNPMRTKPQGTFRIAGAQSGAIQTDAIRRCGAVIFAGCCHWRRRGFVGRGLSNRRSSRR